MKYIGTYIYVHTYVYICVCTEVLEGVETCGGEGLQSLRRRAPYGFVHKHTWRNKWWFSELQSWECLSVYIWSTHAVLFRAEKSTVDAQQFVASNTPYVPYHECTGVLKFLLWSFVRRSIPWSRRARLICNTVVGVTMRIQAISAWQMAGNFSSQKLYTDNCNQNTQFLLSVSSIFVIGDGPETDRPTSNIHRSILTAMYARLAGLPVSADMCMLTILNQNPHHVHDGCGLLLGRTRIAQSAVTTQSILQ